MAGPGADGALGLYEGAGIVRVGAANPGREIAEGGGVNEGPAGKDRGWTGLILGTVGAVGVANFGGDAKVGAIGSILRASIRDDGRVGPAGQLRVVRGAVGFR
jgi:hypothetical protein